MTKTAFVCLGAILALALFAGCSQMVDNSTQPGNSMANVENYDQTDNSLSSDPNSGPPWVDHAHPWTFMFGNSFDVMHQLREIDHNQLTGFMYISFTNADTAVVGTDLVAWNVHCIAANAYWDSTMAKWVVNGADVPIQPGYVFWWPVGNIDSAQHADSAPGYFFRHIARFPFFFLPQNRMVEHGIDFGFPHNYVTMQDTIRTFTKQF